MSETPEQFDPSMFKTLEEMREAFPEEAEDFTKTEDGMGFVRKTAIHNPEKARVDSILQRRIDDFLKSCNDLVESDLPDETKERAKEILDEMKKKLGPNLEYLYPRDLDDLNCKLVNLSAYMPITNSEHSQLCDIPEEERSAIMDKLVDLGTEPDLMCHKTRLTNLTKINLYHGIIAEKPKFARRSSIKAELKNIVKNKTPGFSDQGTQSISCWDPHYEIELLRDIQKNKDHKIYAMFVPDYVIDRLPDKPTSYRNTKVEPGSALDSAIRNYISGFYNCDIIINSVYHTGGRRLVVHGEMTFKPEGAKELLLRPRRSRYDRFQKREGSHRKLPDEHFIEGSIEDEIDAKSQPEKIINKFAPDAEGGRVTLLIKPTEGDLKSGKVVRYLRLFDPDADHNDESDWESRIPIDRIIGVVFDKNMALPGAVHFAHNLHIPIYDSSGGLIWPEEKSREELSIQDRAN